MYAYLDVHLRDPSVSNDFLDSPSRASWLPYLEHSVFNRALTPPPDMNGSSYTSQWHDYSTANERRHDTFAYGSEPYEAPISSQTNLSVSTADLGRNGTANDIRCRSFSPSSQPRQLALDHSQRTAQQKRGSQANPIAPSFQIPKSVNDSGGSLSELAAQITCLFWFESSELLRQIEGSVGTFQPLRPLTPDSKPTTGFRKWVTTILSTTLVAQNVVILALLFIYRLKKLNPTVQGKPGSEYRLFTVALMLGNKFLDDNTYTNRTWAEVSGINVNEVHIMEVEFLSNMKYCLYTNSDEWTEWQSLLGKFAAYFERASKPQPPAALLPPTSSLNLPKPLPSPPASNQASPPYMADLASSGTAYGSAGLPGPSPAPSPHVFLSNDVNPQNPRKRSYDEQAVEPPPKRQEYTYPDYRSPYSYTLPQNSQLSQIPRLPLPSLSVLPVQGSSSNYPQSNTQPQQQLPLPNVPGRAMAMVYPNASSQAVLPQMQALAGSSQPPSQVHSQYQSRQQSPYITSAAQSPANSLPQPVTSMHPALQISPTYFLRHRNSPYRPVHNVSTLLYPPPSAALQQQPQSIESHQMYYQPLGKPQQRQTGHLPYHKQNLWLDGTFPETMTPIQQWPSFVNTEQQRQRRQQQEVQLIPQQ